MADGKGGVRDIPLIGGLIGGIMDLLKLPFDAAGKGLDVVGDVASLGMKGLVFSFIGGFLCKIFAKMMPQHAALLNKVGEVFDAAKDKIWDGLKLAGKEGAKLVGQGVDAAAGAVGVHGEEQAISAADKLARTIRGDNAPATPAPDATPDHSTPPTTTPRGTLRNEHATRSPPANDPAPSGGTGRGTTPSARRNADLAATAGL